MFKTIEQTKTNVIAFQDFVSLKQNKCQPIQCDQTKCGEIVKSDVYDDSEIRMN